MEYKSIELIADKKKKRLTLEYRGQEGEWEQHGILAEIFPVESHLVLVNVLSQKPFAVIHNLEELKIFIDNKYKVNLKFEGVL